LDRAVIASGEPLHNFEEDHVDAHGVRRQLLATKVPLQDQHDRVQGVVTVALDISDRKRAEQALKESETRFMQAARLANLGHWAWDEIEDRCTYCSEELARIHGVTVETYLAATNSVDGDLARIHPDDRHEYDRVTRKWAGRQDTYDIEYRIVRPDGEVRHVRELAEAIRGETGRMVRSIGTKQDITVAKQAEAELLVAKQRAEAANNLVVEKNRMLESLSSKLSKYLSPQIYASIFSGERSVEIASQRKKITVFFSDIADFTESTDQLESEELTSLLNQYLTEMSKIALAYGATIDKFVGDAIMLFLGDPSTKGAKEDAVACVEMAVAMQQRMRELQFEWLDRGMEHPFQLRIGINTGYCTVGNFGSEDRMDYTIVGNEVNLAARLQTHAELGGILVANETYSLVKDVIQAEEQSPITVKGFARPVRTFSVTGIYDDLIAEGKIIRAEQDGLRLLIDLDKQDKADTIKAIEEVLAKLKD
jgi:PAS domain S-box-containing protein